MFPPKYKVDLYEPFWRSIFFDHSLSCLYTQIKAMIEANIHRINTKETASFHLFFSIRISFKKKKHSFIDFWLFWVFVAVLELSLKLSEITQSCPTLCDPMDCSLPGSSIHGIFQARVLEWAAISFSRVSSHPRDQTLVSCTAGRFFTN